MMMRVRLAPVPASGPGSAQITSRLVDLTSSAAADARTARPPCIHPPIPFRIGASTVDGDRGCRRRYQGRDPGRFRSQGQLNVASTFLAGRLQPNQSGGVCHQLVEDDEQLLQTDSFAEWVSGLGAQPEVAAIRLGAERIK